MKVFSFVLALFFLGLSQPVWAQDGTDTGGTDATDADLPEVTVECGFFGSIFDNSSENNKDICVQASDNCPGGHASTIGIKGGAQKEVPDGGTKTFAFTVKPGESVVLGCRGSSGTNCTYTITPC